MLTVRRAGVVGTLVVIVAALTGRGSVGYYYWRHLVIARLQEGWHRRLGLVPSAVSISGGRPGETQWVSYPEPARPASSVVLRIKPSGIWFASRWIDQALSSKPGDHGYVYRQQYLGGQN